MQNTKANITKNSTINAIVKKYVARYFKVIPPLVLFLVILAGFLFLLKPKYNSIIREVDSENQQRTEQFNSESGYKDALLQLQRAYKAISGNDLARINKMLPNTPEVENIMVMLENITDKQYIKLNSLNFSKGEVQAKKSPVTVGQDSERLKKLSINMDIGGIDYRGLKKLLVVLENNLRLFDIDSIDFNPDGNSVNLSMTAYYWESGA